MQNAGCGMRNAKFRFLSQVVKNLNGMKIVRTELPFAATSMFLFLVSEKGTEKAELRGAAP